jgi:hypothetical protein
METIDQTGLRLQDIGWKGDVHRVALAEGYGTSVVVGDQTGLHRWGMASAGIWLDDSSMLTVGGMSRFDYYWDFYKRHTTGSTEIFALKWRGKFYHAAFTDPSISVSKFKDQINLIYEQYGIQIEQRRLPGVVYEEDGSLWVPGVLASIKHDWDAKNIAGLTPGQSVSTWPDIISGALFTGVTSTRPIWVPNSGDPYVEFDGSDDNMQATIADTNDYVVVVIWERITSGFYHRLLESQSRGIILCQDSTSNAQINIPALGSQVGVATPAPPTGFLCLMAERLGSAGRLRINGTQATATLNTVAVGTTLFLGSDFTATTNGNVRVKRVIFCNAAFQAGEQAKLAAYILSEYGLVL